MAEKPPLLVEAAEVLLEHMKARVGDQIDPLLVGRLVDLVREAKKPLVDPLIARIEQLQERLERVEKIALKTHNEFQMAVRPKRGVVPASVKDAIDGPSSS